MEQRITMLECRVHELSVQVAYWQGAAHSQTRPQYRRGNNGPRANRNQNHYQRNQINNIDTATQEYNATETVQNDEKDGDIEAEESSNAPSLSTVSNVGSSMVSIAARDESVEATSTVERRFKEVHQSEEFLQGRVEELEQTESVLRRELSTVDRRISNRECKWQHKVDDLQDELNLHQELKFETSSTNNYLSLTDQENHTIIKRENEGRHSLRIQVEGLNKSVELLNKDIEDKNDQMKSFEASLRSEVIIPTKMR